MGVKMAILGDLLYDCFVFADRLPRVGEPVTGYKNGFFAGGKGGNQAVQAARLGAESRMIGKVGRDERGEFLLRNFKENGVLTEGILVDETIPTGTCCVMVADDGRNLIIVVPLANDHIAPSELIAQSALIETSDVLVAQLQINLDAVACGLTIAKDAGVLTVLNPAPAKAVPDRFFELADFVTPNETEAEFYSGLYRDQMDFQAFCAGASEAFLDRGARRVLLTLGAKGAYYRDHKTSFHAPAFKIDAVDSTAAGDSFNVAFAYAMVSGADAQKAVAYGNAAGALTASRYGSMPSMPKKAEIDAFLKRQEGVP